MSSKQPPICAAGAILHTLRGRWAPALLATLAAEGPIHFLALTRALPGISRKVLSEQLRFFDQAGVITQTRQTDRQEVLYELSNRGGELKRAIDELNDLAARWPSL